MKREENEKVSQQYLHVRLLWMSQARRQTRLAHFQFQSLLLLLGLN